MESKYTKCCPMTTSFTLSYPRVGLEDAIVGANARQDAALEFKDWHQVDVDNGRVVPN